MVTPVRSLLLALLCVVAASARELQQAATCPPAGFNSAGNFDIVRYTAAPW
jgi:hypothetical protein